MPRRSQTQALDVYLNGEKVGRWTRSRSGAVEFTYDPQWLNSGTAISHSLPLREEPYRGDAASDFFDNLLPDNREIRRAIADELGVRSQPFELVGALGRDCIGALQFLPPDSAPPTLAPASGRPLSEHAVASILQDLPERPLGASAESEFRISLAGAQHKTALLWLDDRWQEPLGATPTTHIFKPPMGRLDNGIDLSLSVENEWLCLEIAQRLGADTAHAQIARFEDEKCLVVERFDRKRQPSGVIERLPAEDVCQALGIPWTRKYQNQGGPSVADVMNLLNASDRPEQDKVTFMRAQLIFFLLRATDGHAKNFSLMRTSRGFVLAPLYDILSVSPAIASHQIEKKDVKMAMKIGGKYRAFEIYRRNFDKTATRHGIEAATLNAIIEDLTDRAEGLVSDGFELPSEFPDEVYDTIISGIRESLGRLT